MLTGKEKRLSDAAHRASGLTRTVGMIAPPFGPPIDGESHVPVRYPVKNTLTES